LVFFLSTSMLSGQFIFGMSTGIGMAQIEKDNLKGFKKFHYDLGLLGGYKLKNANSILLEMHYTSFGSKKGNENLPANPDKVLAELDVQSANILLGYAFYFNDAWDDAKTFRFSSGLRFHRVISSEISAFKRGEFLNFKDEIDWSFITLKLGPGVVIKDGIFLDFYYEHKMYDFNFSNPVENVRSLTPFQFQFAISYYL